MVANIFLPEEGLCHWGGFPEETDIWPQRQIQPHLKSQEIAGTLKLQLFSILLFIKGVEYIVIVI